MARGIGMVAFTVTVLARSSLTNARCVRPGREGAGFIPGLISTAKEMWQIYLLLTLGPSSSSSSRGSPSGTG